MYLAEIEIIQNMSSLDLEVSVESILGKVPLRSPQAVAPDEIPHGVSVQPRETNPAFIIGRLKVLKYFHAVDMPALLCHKVP